MSDQDTQPKSNRMSIVLFSGTLDKLLAMSILATGASALGMDVEIFLSNWGVMAFRKGDYQTNHRVSADYSDMAANLLNQLEAKRASSWFENLDGAKEIGSVHVAACSHTMTLFDLELTDLEPIVDEVSGIAAFIERARDSALTYFI